MFLRQLSLINFKNYSEFEAIFINKVNCFVGNNGLGKTNLLDAIHYLSFCKSYFNSLDGQNIKHNEGFFVINGQFYKSGDTIVLKQRNALLKHFFESRSYDSETIDIWNEQLISYGNSILEIRLDFLKKFIPLFNKFYQFISDSEELATLIYSNSIGDKSFKVALITSLARDRAVQYTTIGPHKDDLDFLLNGFSLKKFASQGQQKSFLLALKLAQFDFIKEQKNIKPLLLLDDVYDKLDETRFTKLLEMVSSENFGQIFITDTHPERIEKLLNDKQIENKIFIISSN